MLSVGQCILVVVGTIVFSMGFLAVLRAIWPASQRTEHNDIIGWQISVLGTTYAVILAFMLWNVWNNFQTARINAEMESNYLVDLYRIAGGLPAAQSQSVRSLAREYADIMVNEEWPAMEQSQLSTHGFAITQQIWDSLVQVRADGAAALSVPRQTVLDQAFNAVRNMSERRRLRQLESRLKLPGILWAVLIVGGIVVIGSACLFGCQNVTLHFLHVFVLSFLLSLVLVAVAEIDRPFQGPLHVQPDSFIFAQQTFKQLPQ